MICLRGILSKKTQNQEVNLLQNKSDSMILIYSVLTENTIQGGGGGGGGVDEGGQGGGVEWQNSVTDILD